MENGRVKQSKKKKKEIKREEDVGDERKLKRAEKKNK